MIVSLLLQPSSQNSWIDLRLVAILGVVYGLLIWSLPQNLSKSIFLFLNLRQLLIRLGRELIVRGSGVEYANSKISSWLCELFLDFSQALSFLPHLSLQSVLRWRHLDLFWLHLDSWFASWSNVSHISIQIIQAFAILKIWHFNNFNLFLVLFFKF